MKQKLLLLYIACCFFACKPEPDEVKPNQHLYSYLSKEQLEKTPYFTNPAFDTLTFISNLNDTLAFVKTKTDSGFYEENFKDHPSGPTIYLYSQFIHNTYKTIKGDGSFWVRHSKKTKEGHKDMIEIFLKDLRFTFGDLSIGNIKHPNYKKLIEINNEVFEHIISIPSENDKLNIDGYINYNYGLFYILNRKENLNFLILKNK